MTTKQKPTCEQLIDDRLKDRLEQIQKSVGLEPDEEGYFEPTHIEKITTYRVQLSGGGPADFFELDHDGDDWRGGQYIYQDWGDRATRRIPGFYGDQTGYHEVEVEELAEAFGIYL